MYAGRGDHFTTEDIHTVLREIFARFILAHHELGEIKFQSLTLLRHIVVHKSQVDIEW